MRSGEPGPPGVTLTRRRESLRKNPQSHLRPTHNSDGLRSPGLLTHQTSGWVSVGPGDGPVYSTGESDPYRSSISPGPLRRRRDRTFGVEVIEGFVWTS